MPPIEYACGKLAHWNFRKECGNLLTRCVLEPNHTGNHVYCHRVSDGVDEHSHALHFLEEIERTKLKPIAYFDMDGSVPIPYKECCALWQYWVLVKKHGVKVKDKLDGTK